MIFNDLTFATYRDKRDNLNFPESATGGFSGCCEPRKWGAGPLRAEKTRT